MVSILKNKLYFLKCAITEVYEVANSEMLWKRKFELIFSDSISEQVRKWLNELELSFDWYDPDTSYEEDVKAYVRGLEDLERELGKLYEDISISHISDPYTYYYSSSRSYTV